MRKEDLDKIITAALNIANENASVYGSQITKDHKDKIIFRPDSYIKLAADPPVTDPVDETKTPVPPPIEETKTPADDSEKKTTLNAPGGNASFQKLDMSWQNANDTFTMFSEFFASILNAYGGDNLKSIGFYKIDPSEEKPKPLEPNNLYEFAYRLESKLKNIKYTTKFDVATVGQGERGGEKIMSLYDLISLNETLDFTTFPQYRLKTINALLQINAQIKQDILKKTSTPSMIENIREFDKNTGWWNTLKDSFRGIQESLITRN